MLSKDREGKRNVEDWNGHCRYMVENTMSALHKLFLNVFPVREIEITFKISKKGQYTVKIKDFNINSKGQVIY